MSARDQPICRRQSDTKTPDDTHDPAIREQIRTLLDDQPFAVLCTQGGGQPYGSVVAFAVSEDLSAVIFATPVATWKYRLLSKCDRVALVIDSRARFPDDMMKVEAITATGRAVQLDPGPEFDRSADLLAIRHPQLKRFVVSPSSALFRIDIQRYLHVTRFQEAHEWIPASHG
jgi:hypothetical protein